MNPLIVVALISFLTGSGVGWYVADAVSGRQIAQMEADYTKERATATKMALDQLTAAQALGDTLSDRLAQTESNLTQKTKELSNALSKVTTGRTCLNGAAVRLLNNTGANDSAVSQATGSSVAVDAAVATDTDIADWIGSAKGQYETCRARLGVLIDFETQKDAQYD